ncbi:hypothetical protein D3C86_2090340 [compost metagenome]
MHAYNDVFALTALIAVLYLLWSLALAGHARRAALLLNKQSAQSSDQRAAAGATDAGATDAAPGEAPAPAGPRQS